MKTSQKLERGFVATALLIVVAAMFVTGGVYIYSKTQENRAKDDLISNAQKNLQASRPTEQALQISADLAWAKTRLQMETTKLVELKEQSRAAIILNSALRDTYLKVNDAISNKADVLFNNPHSLDPDFKFTTTAALENKLNNARAEITQILNSWQALVTGGSSPQNSAALQKAIHEDLPDIKTYLQELATVVNNLTPGNSGLTQQEIIQYQNTVNNATQQVNAAVNNLTGAENQATQSGNTGGTNTTSNSNTGGTQTGTQNSNQTDVQNQQTVIDQIQQQIQLLEQQLQQQNQGQQGGNNNPNQPFNQIEAAVQASTTSSGYFGETDSVVQSTSGQIIYPPNPAPTRPPRDPSDHDLIEGTNTGN